MYIHTNISSSIIQQWETSLTMSMSLQGTGSLGTARSRIVWMRMIAMLIMVMLMMMIRTLDDERWWCWTSCLTIVVHCTDSAPHLCARRHDPMRHVAHHVYVASSHTLGTARSHIVWLLMFTMLLMVMFMMMIRTLDDGDDVMMMLMMMKSWCWQLLINENAVAHDDHVHTYATDDTVRATPHLIEPYWILFIPIDPYWYLVIPYWSLSIPIDHYWSLLILLIPYWYLMILYWSLLIPVGPYWLSVVLILIDPLDLLIALMSIDPQWFYKPYWSLLIPIDPYWFKFN